MCIRDRLWRHIWSATRPTCVLSVFQKPVNSSSLTYRNRRTEGDIGHATCVIPANIKTRLLIFKRQLLCSLHSRPKHSGSVTLRPTDHYWTHNITFLRSKVLKPIIWLEKKTLKALDISQRLSLIHIFCSSSSETALERNKSHSRECEAKIKLNYSLR